MQHNYTNSELDTAVGESFDITGDAPLLDVSFNGLRKFLDALPDVPHWGDCAVDRAKAGVYEQLLDHPYFDGWSEADASVEDYMIGRLNEAHAAEQHDPKIPVADVRKGDRVRVLTTIGNYYEFTVTDIDTQLGMLMWNGGNVYKRSVQRVWLINRPIQHPDPLEHPVILVHESVDAVYDEPIPMIWEGGNFYESPRKTLHINTILRFTPAKVVADDD